ncbi:hypothetical protein BJY04DRAFT_232980 [Aspergillus karnatakaensis]|uniref:isopenicillin N synthase family dioxygenase n=1 Tax=Aspergillus karnatakaensis TaxID=1810916 RepID=UPI003CCE0DD0
MASNFSSIPILDFAETKSPATRAKFVSDLRNALVNIGFFYLTNHSIPEDLQVELREEANQFFDLPIEKKSEIEMVHSKHYYGYVRVGNEFSGPNADYRESLTLGMENPEPAADEPLYRNMTGPNLWPPEATLPTFRSTVTNYISSIRHLAESFKPLAAEALGLEPTALLPFFDDRPADRFKLIKYPEPSSLQSLASSKSENAQDPTVFSGIGPHKDGTFLTFLLQGTDHAGLEIQNKSGEWIPATPVPGTLVVNIGRGFEALTGGVCSATTHRVNLHPENFVDRETGEALGARLSFPFFQTFRLDLRKEEMPLKLPREIMQLVEGREVRSDARGMAQEVYDNLVGDGLFWGSAIKHPRVARKWYPEILDKAEAARV